MSRPLHVLLLDTGKEWGGGTNSMLEWLRRRDRSQFRVTCVFYTNYRRGGDAVSVEQAVREADAEFILLPAPRQPAWAKLTKELARGLLHLAPAVRRRAVDKVEFVWRILPAVQRLVNVIRSTRPDLIYMNNQPTSNYEGYLAGAQTRLPVVQHCRTQPHCSAELAEVVNRQAACVLAVSDSVGQALVEQGVNKSKIRVVFNGVDLEQALPQPENLVDRLGIPADMPVLACVGSLMPRKRMDDVICALAAMITPAHLLMLGDGSEHARLTSLAAQLGVVERVHFLGFIPRPLSWMAASDAVVLASESEGMPRVLLEAMLLGKPVIASDVPGTRDVVVHGETGWLFPCQNSVAFAHHLDATFNLFDRGKALGAAGRKRVLTRFGIERYVMDVSRILRDAAGA